MPRPKKTPDYAYQYVTNAKEANKLAKKLRRQKIIYFDTEGNPKFNTLQFTIYEDYSKYDKYDYVVNLERVGEGACLIFKEVLENRQILFIMYAGRQDQGLLSREENGSIDLRYWLDLQLSLYYMTKDRSDYLGGCLFQAGFIDGRKFFLNDLTDEQVKKAKKHKKKLQRSFSFNSRILSEQQQKYARDDTSVLAVMYETALSMDAFNTVIKSISIETKIVGTHLSKAETDTRFTKIKNNFKFNNDDPLYTPHPFDNEILFPTTAFEALDDLGWTSGEEKVDNEEEYGLDLKEIKEAWDKNNFEKESIGDSGLGESVSTVNAPKPAKKSLLNDPNETFLNKKPILYALNDDFYDPHTYVPSYMIMDMVRHGFRLDNKYVRALRNKTELALLNKELDDRRRWIFEHAEEVEAWEHGIDDRLVGYGYSSDSDGEDDWDYEDEIAPDNVYSIPETLIKCWGFGLTDDPTSDDNEGGCWSWSERKKEKKDERKKRRKNWRKKWAEKRKLNSSKN